MPKLTNRILMDDQKDQGCHSPLDIKKQLAESKAKAMEAHIKKLRAMR